MMLLKIYLLLVMLTKYGIGRQNRPWPDVFSCRLHVSSRGPGVVKAHFLVVRAKKMYA
jgi:hypothetical protein